MSLGRYRLLVSYVLLVGSMVVFQYDGFGSVVLFVCGLGWFIGSYMAGKDERA